MRFNMKKNTPAEPIKTVLGTLQDNRNICKGMPPETEIKLAMPESVHQKPPQLQSAIGLLCSGGMATKSILTGRKCFLKYKKAVNTDMLPIKVTSAALDM